MHIGVSLLTEDMDNLYDVLKLSGEVEERVIAVHMILRMLSHVSYICVYIS